MAPKFHIFFQSRRRNSLHWPWPHLPAVNYDDVTKERNWSHDGDMGSRNFAEILIESKRVDEFSLHLNIFLKVIEKTFLYIGPNQIRPHSQK